MTRNAEAAPPVVRPGQDEEDGMVAVGCGCRPRVSAGKRKKKGWFRRSRNDKPRKSARDIKEDMTDGHKDRVPELRMIRTDSTKSLTSGPNLYGEEEEDEDDSCFFFDAEEELLPDDQFPPSPGNKSAPSRVFDDDLFFSFRPIPEKRRQSRRRSSSKRVVQQEQEQAPSDAASQVTVPEATTTTCNNSTRQPMNLFQKHPSGRFDSILQMSQDEMLHQIQHPRVVLDGNGYPGTLNDTQMEQAKLFLELLPKMCRETPGLAEQIYSFRDVEDLPYTLCRWLRATKWDAKAILERCAQNQPQFNVASQHAFHPDVSASIGAPFPVFLSQYPLLAVGTGKNGCPVNYFQAGHINPQGIMALTTVEKLEGYFWWSFMHKMKSEIRGQQSRNPNAVRCEGINIIDLQGLSRAALSSETMSVIQLAGKISDFFPEVRTVVIGMWWRIRSALFRLYRTCMLVSVGLTTK